MIKGENKKYKRLTNDSVNFECRTHYNKAFLNQSKYLIYSKILKVSLILLLCFIAVFLIANKDRLSIFNVGFGQKGIESMRLGYPVDITGHRVSSGNFNVVDDYISMVSDTSFVVMNKKGKKLVNKQHSISDPILKTAGNRAILYSVGGNDAQIENKADTLHKVNLSNNIVSGDISPLGEYVFVTDSDRYLSEMTAFSSNGLEKYKYYFADYYVTDVAIGKDGKSAVVSGISSVDGILNSAVYIFNFSKQSPRFILEYPENFIFHVEYFSDKAIAAIGDKLISFSKYRKNKKVDYFYNNRRLTCCEVNPNLGVAISLSSTLDNRNCEVIVFDKCGNIKSNINTDLKVDSISYNNDVIALLSNGYIYEYTYNGKLKGKVFVGNDSKKIQLLSSKSAYVLGINEVRLIKIKFM